ncbi:MAG: peptidoglycan DD-metalloendopeptidase family protein [Candidatus Paceibacterota bacterium]|jgi:murein DD-endopeptidase MepM/ murein hydrolase activator NlpD
MRKSSNSILSFALAVALLCAAGVARAATIDQLRSQIEAGNQKVEELTREIEILSKDLNATAKQSQTLANALKQLELTKKKLAADIALTSRRIDSTSASIEELSQSIATAERGIDKSSVAMAASLRLIDAAESQSIIEELLKGRSISGAWDYVSTLGDVEEAVRLRLIDLRDQRDDLSEKKDKMESEKKNLVVYGKQLTDQKKVAEYNSLETTKLLSTTKNKQAEYEKELAKKKAEKDAFEAELFSYESQLQIAIDPNSIPGARKGVLRWPLDKIYVTQYFGYTKAAAILYKTTAKHGGIDFRATTGTPVIASLSGIVTDTEANTAKSGCQYGKFVLIKHANGLSTIYGHLSTVSVKPGDTVITGDRIGYSGYSGFVYPPGPSGAHLHFGVYATQGIRIVDARTLGSSKCAGIKTVAADPKAYLDPLGYLPK